MSIQGMRNRIQKDSPTAKTFKKKATPGKVALFSLLSVAAFAVGGWMWLESVGFAWFIVLVIGVIFAAVAIDAARTLRR